MIANTGNIGKVSRHRLIQSSAGTSEHASTMLAQDQSRTVSAFDAAYRQVPMPSAHTMIQRDPLLAGRNFAPAVFVGSNRRLLSGVRQRPRAWFPAPFESWRETGA